MTQVQIAALGAGGIVREFHLPALLSNPRVRVAALANLHSQSLRKTGSQFGIERLESNFDRIAEDPGIDGVLNALPNHLHAPVTVAMLEHGKHVLCEKPMAMSPAEAQSMVAAADAAGRTLAIGYPWRVDSEVGWLRRVVQSGVLGKIFKIRAHSVVSCGGPGESSWQRQPKFSGGGALIDVGIHAVNAISFLFDDTLRPRRVFAHTSASIHPSAVEDTADVLVEFRNELTVTLEAGWHHFSNPDPHGALEIFGDGGYARIFPPQLISRIPAAEELQPPPAREKDQHINSRMYEAQIDRFVGCILDGAKPPCDARQGFWDMRIIQAAYRSAATGESVNMEETE